MMCQARDKNNNISIDVVIKADGFTEEQLEILWIKFSKEISDKMVEMRQEGNIQDIVQGIEDKLDKAKNKQKEGNNVKT